MDLGLKGRVALVCASTSGLGEAIARTVAAEGAHTIVCGRNEGRATTVAAELPNAIGLPFDISTPSAGPKLLEDTRREAGSPDILILNGPGPRPAKAREINPNEMSAGLDTLLGVQMALVEEALPAMIDKGWGRIVAIGSSGVVAPIESLAISNVGRAALAAYLKTLSAEVAPYGITVNLVLPGRISTSRTKAIDVSKAEREGVSPDEIARRSKESIPMGRYGRPSEFAAAATFLCSSQASYITGSILRCDGGLIRSL